MEIFFGKGSFAERAKPLAGIRENEGDKRLY
jgi:hypothetical protein